MLAEPQRPQLVQLLLALGQELVGHAGGVVGVISEGRDL